MKLVYTCCDCKRGFVSEYPPREFLGDYLCDECAVAFDQTLKDLAKKGVRLEVNGKPQ